MAASSPGGGLGPQAVKNDGRFTSILSLLNDNRSWSTPDMDSMPWIRGRPGAGKSMLASYAVSGSEHYKNESKMVVGIVGAPEISPYLQIHSSQSDNYYLGLRHLIQWHCLRFQQCTRRDQVHFRVANRTTTCRYIWYR